VDTILTNAIASIQIGVEDFISNDERRIVSSARNLTSGILLIFKHKLLIISPHNSDVLIKQKIVPTLKDNNLIFTGLGKDTVTVSQIKERFKNLEIQVNWKVVDEIIGLRNNIEHFCVDLNNNLVKEILSKSFYILIEFISKYLNIDPEELLGKDTFLTLQKESFEYNTKLTKCLNEIYLVSIKIPSLKHVINEIRCSNCLSQLIIPNDTNEIEQLQFTCTICGHIDYYTKIIDKIIDDKFIPSQSDIKDGADSPITTCHICGNDSFLLTDNVCLSCGAKLEYLECNICGNMLSPFEQEFNGLCSYHYHLFTKDD
jgi:hypothetical protein